MGSGSDFQRLSAYVSGIVDRKVKAITMSINSSTGYFRSLIAEAAVSAANALTYSTNSKDASIVAAGHAGTTQAIWNSYTSLFLGLQANDPQLSSIGRPVTVGANYIRVSDKRLRVALTSVNGVVTWADATVAADPDSVIAIAQTRFLFLNKDSLQEVKGPVKFSGPTTVPSAAWDSEFAVKAKDADTRFKTVAQSVVTEKDRAVLAEGEIVQLIEDEETRAKGAEDLLGSAIGTLGTNLSKNISDEVTRAQGVEQSIAASVTTEHDRAVQVESLLDADISDLMEFVNKFHQGSNDYGYWEIRPGVTEMWGRVYSPSSSEGTTFVTLPLILPSPDYNISITPMINAAGIKNDSWCQFILNTVSGNGFGVQYQADDANDRHIDGYDWVVKFAQAVPPPAAPTPTPSPTPSPTPDPTPGPTPSPSPTPSPTPTPTPTPAPSPSPSTPPRCPEDITPVLLANAERNGPGEFTTAGALAPDMWVWTQHEQSMEFGAYRVTHADTFVDDLWEATGYYRATKLHPFYLNDVWVEMYEIGAYSGQGTAVKITIDNAHTFITLDKNGNHVLNHNIKQEPNVVEN